MGFVINSNIVIRNWLSFEVFYIVIDWYGNVDWFLCLVVGKRRGN